MKIIAIIIPTLLIILLFYCFFKKINIYNSFVEGSKQAFPLVLSMFPYIVTIMLMCEVFEVSGLSEKFINILTPIFKFFGVPKELIKLIIIKPFSGSGSLAILSDIYKTYGVNSITSLLASSVYGSSETIFYISAVYYSKCVNKKATKGIIISLVATILSTIICCLFIKLFY